MVLTLGAFACEPADHYRYASASEFKVTPSGVKTGCRLLGLIKELYISANTWHREKGRRPGPTYIDCLITQYHFHIRVETNPKFRAVVSISGCYDQVAQTVLRDALLRAERTNRACYVGWSTQYGHRSGCQDEEAVLV